MAEERSRFQISWAFADQGMSSATNFALSLLGGRILGPGGLGVIFLGFSAYLIVLSYQRGMVTDPLVATSTRLDASEKEHSTRSALTTVILGSLVLALVVAFLALLIGGSVGRGLLLFAPWLPMALVQDFWRVVLFRDGRASAATANDGAWLLAMAICVPIALALRTDWAVVGCWGIGALVGAVLGFGQVRERPISLALAFRWYQSDGWPLGRWLAVSGTISNLGSRILAFILVAILGIEAVGGLQATQTLFAPLTLIIGAVGLAGLPALTRALSDSSRSAKTLALRMGGLAIAATVILVGLLSLGGGALLPLLFGSSFNKYRVLVWPIFLSQLATASSVGFALLLKAQKRGGAVMVQELALALFTLSLVPGFAHATGVQGAAWGLALSAVLTSVVIIVLALRRPNAAFEHRADAQQERAEQIRASEWPPP